MEKQYDYKLSTVIEAVHPEWARPYVKGPIKAFFVPSVRLGREIVELVQRMDIEHDNVTIDRFWDANKWGFGDFYGKRGGLKDFEVVYRNLEKAMLSDERYDVLVLPGLNGWAYFTEKTREAILARVKQGTGLVLIHPYDGEGMEPTAELKELSPLRSLHEEGFHPTGYCHPRFIDLAKLGKDRWIPKPHYITHGIPFELFPYEEMGYYPYEAEGEVIIASESGAPVAAVKECGMGRIAAFGYYPRDVLPQHNEYTWYDKCYEPIVANWEGHHHKLTYNYLEYFYGLIYRSMAWAARKEPDAVIESAAIGNDSVRVMLSRPGEFTIEYRIKNLYDEQVEAGVTPQPVIPLPSRLKHGGRFRVEILLKEGDKTSDWFTVAADYPMISSITGVSKDRNVTVPGDVISVSAAVEGTEGVLEWNVVDDFGRVIHAESAAVHESASLHLRYTVPPIRSLHGKFRAVLRIDGFVVDRKETEPFVITPQDRKLDDFEVLLCPQNRGQGDLFDLEAQRLYEMGVTGSFIGDSKMSTLSGAEGCGIGWNDRDEYVAMKESYYLTKDKSLLQRTPCLNDPDFQEKNVREVVKTLQGNAKYGPLAYFAQDEGSMTCYADELDICFCPHCLAAMREWLHGEYRDLQQLNDTWGTRFAAWEDVVPYTYEEAVKTGEFASWGDHRLFMELTYADAYRRIRDAIRTVDPAGEVRMSGCQASTPYTGCDYYLLHQAIGYFEAYGVGNQYEFHRSFANPGTIIGSWFGYGSSGATVQHNLWHALYHGMTLISVFWEYSCLNPDFTFSQSAVDMGEVFKEIKREGIGKLLLHSAKRDHLGIAVHYSMPSVHGSYIRGDLARFEKNRQGWIDLLQDLGYQYDFVASQQIEAGHLLDQGFKLLILPYSIALSPKETEEIRRFAEAGGFVIGDFQTGLMDRHNKLNERGSLDELFGIRRLMTDTQPFFLQNEFTQVKEFPYFAQRLYGTSDFAMAERGTRAAGGRAGYTDDFSKHVAAVVVNEYGKGKAVYLNIPLDAYPGLRSRPEGGKDTRELMKNVLALAEVRKPAGIFSADGEAVESGYESFYYRNNGAKYVGILRELGGRQARTGYDGLATGDVEEAGAGPDRIRVEFGKPAHVYDVRSKKYLGFAERAEAVIAPGATAIFALLPYKVNGIEVRHDRQIRAGEKLRLHIRVDSGKPEGDYAHVLSVRFYNPAGEYEWIYSANIAVDGSVHEVIHDIPHNEKPGEWKLSVKDAASGVTVEKWFEIVR